MAPYNAQSTTARGLGAAHQQRAAYLHRVHVDGTPCRRCHQPMYSNPARNPDRAKLEAGHPDGAERARGGKQLPDALEHRRCNRSAGARFGAQLRRVQARSRERYSEDW